MFRAQRSLSEFIGDSESMGSTVNLDVKDTKPTTSSDETDLTVKVAVLACVTSFLAVAVVVLLLYILCRKCCNQSGHRPRDYRETCEHCRHSGQNNRGYQGDGWPGQSLQANHPSVRSTPPFPGTTPNHLQTSISLPQQQAFFQNSASQNLESAAEQRLQHSGQESTQGLELSVSSSVQQDLSLVPTFQNPSGSHNSARINPIYIEDGNSSRHSHLDTVSGLSRLDTVSESSLVIEPGLKGLYQVTERSRTQTVCGKEVVSISRDVDHHGDVLILDNMGIYLRVPKNAVKFGEKQTIVLVLNWDLTDNPSMELTESLVSPVVYVGPHNLKLQKPCVLGFRHCAFNPRQIRVMRSETELTEQKSWRTMCDQNLDQESGPVVLSPDECQITIDTFTLYTCVQAPLNNNIGKKWLQIAVFACPLRRQCDHHQIRVYFLNKTNCALQWAIQNEAKFGGKMVCPEKVFLFDGNDHDMLTLTNYISNGWELLENEKTERVTFLHIWHGQCPYISVCFHRVDQSSSEQTNGTPTLPSTVSIEMNLRLLTYQDELQDNGEKIFIQIIEDNMSPLSSMSPPQCQQPHLGNVNIHIHNNVQGQDSEQSQTPERVPNNSMPGAMPESQSKSSLVQKPLAESGKSDDGSVNIVVNNQVHTNISTSHGATSADHLRNAPPPNIPHEVRKKLVILLDPAKLPYGTDWRDFADKLDFNASAIEFLKSQVSSPTEQLLKDAESGGKSLRDLQQIFHDIGRQDCVNVIDEYVKQKTREPTENSLAGDSREHTGIRELYGCQTHLRAEESSWTGTSSTGNNSNVQQYRSDSDYNSYNPTLSEKLYANDPDQTHYKPNIPP